MRFLAAVRGDCVARRGTISIGHVGVAARADSVSVKISTSGSKISAALPCNTSTRNAPESASPSLSFNAVHHCSISYN